MPTLIGAPCEQPKSGQHENSNVDTRPMSRAAACGDSPSHPKTLSWRKCWSDSSCDGQNSAKYGMTWWTDCASAPVGTRTHAPRCCKPRPAWKSRNCLLSAFHFLELCLSNEPPRRVVHSALCCLISFAFPLLPSHSRCRYNQARYSVLLPSSLCKCIATVHQPKPCLRLKMYGLKFCKDL